MSMYIKPRSRAYCTNKLPLALEPLRHETNSHTPSVTIMLLLRQSLVNRSAILSNIDTLHI